MSSNLESNGIAILENPSQKGVFANQVYIVGLNYGQVYLNSYGKG